MSDNNVKFQLTIFKFGNRLLQSEWTADKDAVCDIADAINHQTNMKNRGYNASIQVAGNGGVTLDNPVLVNHP